MTTIYFVRHGQTDWNLSGLLQGQTDIPLNAHGRAQARESALALRGVRLDAILSSPLSRAVQTAREFADVLDPAVPVLTREGLKERCFGRLEGKSYTDEGLKSALWAFQSPLNQSNDEGVETLDAFCARVNTCIDELLSAYAHQTILLVAHGGVAVPVRLRFEGMPTGARVQDLIPANGSLLRYAVAPDAASCYFQ